MNNNHTGRADDARKAATQQIIRDMTRAKVLFQQRAVAAVLGVPASKGTPNDQ